MVDISKCSGLNCPVRNDCHRFNAKSNDIYQSYIQPPFQIKNGVFSCGLFWGKSALAYAEIELNRLLMNIINEDENKTIKDS